MCPGHTMPPPDSLSVLRRLPSSSSFSAHKPEPLPGEQAGMFHVSGCLLGSGPGFAHPGLPGRLPLSWLLEFICGRQKVENHVQKDEPLGNFCKMGASLLEAEWEGTPHREEGK